LKPYQSKTKSKGQSSPVVGGKPKNSPSPATTTTNNNSGTTAKRGAVKILPAHLSVPKSPTIYNPVVGGGGRGGPANSVSPVLYPPEVAKSPTSSSPFSPLGGYSQAPTVFGHQLTYGYGCRELETLLLGKISFHNIALSYLAAGCPKICMLDIHSTASAIDAEGIVEHIPKYVLVLCVLSMSLCVCLSLFMFLCILNRKKKIF
jgi:hypothetical protein